MRSPLSPDHLLPPLRMHRRRLLYLILAAAALVLLLPRFLSLVRLTAMRLAALSVATHPSAPLPIVVPGLLAAKWHRPRPQEEPNLFMKLHIFSDDTPDGRRRRDMIREHRPASWVKDVQLSFVVPDRTLVEDLELDGGVSNLLENGDSARISPDESNAARISDTDGAGLRRRRPRRSREAARNARPDSLDYTGASAESDLSQSAVAAEAAEFGDVLRVPGRDVAAEWIRAVGRGDAAQWIMKCDDTTLPLLPNIIADLRKRDWRTPTYFGTTDGRSLDRPFYYRGMMYGFSWPVVATVASASSDIASGTSIGDAERTGQLMWSLPSTKGMPRLLRGYPCLLTSCDVSFQEDTMRPALFDRLRKNPDYPRRDDPRTGLRFVNYLGRIEGPEPWIRNDARTAIAYYGLSEEEYVKRFEKLNKAMRTSGGV